MSKTSTNYRQYSADEIYDNYELYYPLPCFLFDDGYKGLSNPARILYAVLLAAEYSKGIGESN